MTTIGTTLIKNAKRHEAKSTNIPPISGPATSAIVVIAVQMPMARALAAPRNVDMMSASELGTSSAPAMPWKTRAMISTSGFGAPAIAIEVRPKPINPMRITRSRPYASLSDPASKMSAPSVMR